MPLLLYSVVNHCVVDMARNADAGFFLFFFKATQVIRKIFPPFFFTRLSFQPMRVPPFPWLWFAGSCRVSLTPSICAALAPMSS